MEKLTVIGIGPGGPQFVTPAARLAIAGAQFVFAAARNACFVPAEKFRPMDNLTDTLCEMRLLCARGACICALVSGDAGLYSLLPLLKKNLGAENLRVIPGIGALQAFCAAICETWQDARILSAHGRALSKNALISTVRAHENTFVFCDAHRSPKWISAVLVEAGLSDVLMDVGERLSYEDERVRKGSPGEIALESYDALSIVRVHNPRNTRAFPSAGLADDAFLRENVPMTKSEVRALVLSRLRLCADAVLWDIGCGTGSVSVECARQCPLGTVYAIDNNPLAINLTKENAQRFGLFNIETVLGTAPSVLLPLSAPTHIFIGGSGGRLAEIFDHIARLKTPFRLAATAVTLESAYAVLEKMRAFQNVQAAQISVSRLERAGTGHLFRAQNPVFVISGDWEAAK